MANGIDWFRWHHGSVTDPKFQLIAKKAGASLPDVLAVWAYILESASASDVRGQFTDIDAEALDCLFSFPDGRSAEILEAMQSRVLDGNAVKRWHERQPKREREDSTAAERKRAQRARDSAQGGDVDDVTPCHAASHQDTPREEESREEEKEQKPQARTKAEGASASRLPADWTPSEDDIAFCQAERPDLRVSDVAARFRDYWHSIPGAKGRKTSWAGTWRNWVRNERRVHSQAPPPYQTQNDKAKQWADKLTGKHRHDQPDEHTIIDINPAPSMG